MNLKFKQLHALRTSRLAKPLVDWAKTAALYEQARALAQRTGCAIMMAQQPRPEHRVLGRTRYVVYLDDANFRL